MAAKPVRVLAVAGSDSGGGAGIQADIRAITALGAFATCAITALTAQNTLGVQAVHAIPAAFVRRQIDSVMSDIGADAVKTGMLPNADIIAVVAQRLRQYDVRTLVIDPVMIAQSGDRLVNDAAVASLVENLAPLATVITPNLAEAGRLAGMEVGSLAAMCEAARRIRALGPRYVVVKGGHLPETSDAIDILYDGDTCQEFSGPRLPSGAHGSGCTFAASLATFLGKGRDIRVAVAAAKEFTARAIAAALRPGAGAPVVNPRGSE